MKMDRELLLKHHFWILLGAFAFFALLLFIIIPIGVGGLISDKEKAIGEMLGKLKAKSPHTNGELTKLENQAQSLAGRRATVHNEMSTRQKDLFWWLTRGLGSGLAGPETAGAKKDLVSFPSDLSKLDSLPFGAPIGDDDRSNYRKESIYLREYEEMATILKPTEYVGGWKTILNPIGWDTRIFPLSEEVWLSLEDLCVRREVLLVLQEANMSIARFTPDKEVAPPPGKRLPLQRTFRSRLWELNLILDKKDKDYVFKGKLKNISGKRQRVYRLDLLVWATPDITPDVERSRPVRLSINQDALAGSGPDQEVEIPETKVNVFDPTGLYRVEQELNEQFVPIKQLVNLVLGKNAGHRMADKPLKTAKFSQPKDDPSAASPSTASSGDGRGSMAGMPGMVGGGTGGGKPGAPGVPGMGSGGVAEETPNRVLKNRYIELTDQVRRMPVGVVIVVDQSNINDVLIAFSNSPRMRFQTTQTHMRRVYGVTMAGSSSGAPSSPAPTPAAGGPSGSTGDDTRGASAGGLKPSGPGIGGMGLGPMGPMGSSAGGPSGVGIPAGPGPGGAGMPTSTSAQSGEPLSAGLVELTIYGIANVYERPKDSTTPTSTTPTPAAPAPAVTPNIPAPKGPPAEKSADKPAAPAEKPADKPLAPAEKSLEKTDKTPRAEEKPMDKTAPGKPADKPADKGKDASDKKN